MSILVRMEDAGININQAMKKLITSNDIPVEVLKFIADNRGLEAINFYEMLRKSHNQKKSPLYTNILKDLKDEDEIVTTLSCLITQILLYSKKLDAKDIFLKEIRAEEISRVLHSYFETSDYTDCLKMLRAIKTDLIVLEYINGRRELA